MGTPNEDSWPGVTALQDWNDEFPYWPTMSLSRFCPGMGEDGIDLVEQCLALDPRRRISAKDALRHPYLKEYASESV